MSALMISGARRLPQIWLLGLLTVYVSAPAYADSVRVVGGDANAFYPSFDEFAFRLRVDGLTFDGRTYEDDYGLAVDRTSDGLLPLENGQPADLSSRFVFPIADSSTPGIRQFAGDFSFVAAASTLSNCAPGEGFVSCDAVARFAFTGEVVAIRR